MHSSVDRSELDGTESSAY